MVSAGQMESDKSQSAAAKTEAIWPHLQLQPSPPRVIQQWLHLSLAALNKAAKCFFTLFQGSRRNSHIDRGLWAYDQNKNFPKTFMTHRSSVFILITPDPPINFTEAKAPKLI